MNHTDKNYKEVYIYKTHGLKEYDYLVLNESSFWNITFDRFEGRNIKMINNKAFGKAAETIKEFIILDGFINYEPLEYNIWKALSSLVNVENINVQLNITEIPSHAFDGNQINLTNITIKTPNQITIKKTSFYYYYLDNLRYLNFKSKIDKIESRAIDFSKNLSDKLYISFWDKIDGKVFDENSFEGLKRPIEISFESEINYLPKTSFKTILDNKINMIKVNKINCSECENYWMIQMNKDDQIVSVKCIQNEKLNLFSPDIKDWFLSNCAPKNESIFSQIFIGLISFCSTLLLILLLWIVYITKKKRNKQMSQSATYNSEECSSQNNLSDENEYPNQEINENIIKTLKSTNLLILREKIQILFEVGCGSFGCVHEGILRNSNDEDVRVAIKTISKAFKNSDDFNERFLNEGLMMKDLKHENVMKLIGICIGDGGSPMIILPFMPKGDLLTYIRGEYNQPTVKDLLNFSTQVIVIWK